MRSASAATPARVVVSGRATSPMPRTTATGTATQTRPCRSMTVPAGQKSTTSTNAAAAKTREVCAASSPTCSAHSGTTTTREDRASPMASTPRPTVSSTRRCRETTCATPGVLALAVGPAVVRAQVGGPPGERRGEDARDHRDAEGRLGPPPRDHRCPDERPDEQPDARDAAEGRHGAGPHLDGCRRREVGLARQEEDGSGRPEHEDRRGRAPTARVRRARGRSRRHPRARRARARTVRRSARRALPRAPPRRTPTGS